MLNNNEQLAFAVLDKFADERVQLIADMQALGYATVEECKPIVIKWACYKVKASYNENDKTGRVTLDTKHAKYETVKTVVRDVMNNLKGTTRRKVSESNATESNATESNATEPVNPFASAVKKFKTEAQARKAFEQALRASFAKS
jgi:hypothetical protein